MPEPAGISIGAGYMAMAEDGFHSDLGGGFNDSHQTKTAATQTPPARRRNYRQIIAASRPSMASAAGTGPDRHR
jgi:hypothetical protein